MSDWASRQMVGSCGLCCDEPEFELDVPIIVLSQQAATEVWFSAFTSMFCWNIRCINTVSPPPVALKAAAPCVSLYLCLVWWFVYFACLWCILLCHCVFLLFPMKLISWLLSHSWCDSVSVCMCVSAASLPAFSVRCTLIIYVTLLVSDSKLAHLQAHPVFG